MGTPAVEYPRILHVDLDQFQVSVERQREPSLVGKVVVVGGNGDPAEARKVVTCASYEARDLGVHAGMPLRTAHRKLADAVWLPVDHAAYDEWSARVMAALRTITPAVEVWGWDEAFVGMAAGTSAARAPRDTAPRDGGLVDDGTDDGPVNRGDATASLEDADSRPLSAQDIESHTVTDATEQALALAHRIRAAVRDATGLSCAIGISDNKQRAKMATGFAKRSDARVFVLDESNWLPLMSDRPCIDIWSVGPRISARLAAIGVHTVSDLIDASRELLIEDFGQHQGTWLYVLARGWGDRTITTEPEPAKSHSKVETFSEDLADIARIRAELRRLTRDLHEQITNEKRVVFRVAVTLRTTTFYTRTKSHKLAEPTTNLAVLEREVLALLDKFEIDRPIRLLGPRFDLLP